MIQLQAVGRFDKAYWLRFPCYLSANTPNLFANTLNPFAIHQTPSKIIKNPSMILNKTFDKLWPSRCTQKKSEWQTLEFRIKIAETFCRKYKKQRDNNNSFDKLVKTT